MLEASRGSRFEPALAGLATPDPEDCWACPANRIARNFAAVRVKALATKVAEAMGEIDSSGIYGDYDLKSLWEDFCFEIQQGPIEQLEEVWDSSLAPFIEAAMENLEPAEEAFLTMTFELDANDRLAEQTDIFTQTLASGLRCALESLAADEALTIG